MADGSAPPPRARYGLTFGEEVDRRAMLRDQELDEQAELGTRHPLFEHGDKIGKAIEAMQPALSDAAKRALVREQVADFLESTVAPAVEGEKLWKLAYKLRAARQECWYQLNLGSGRTRTIWDCKAGEPLLCPDDARQEAMRLQGRLERDVAELARKGYRVYYGVLTIENAEGGHLQSRIEKLWRAWRRALKAKIERAPGDRRRKKDLPKRFPFVGAIATLEAPLSASRTWHPHLNVIVITRGFFDWSDWWKYWRWVSHWKSIKPGQVEGAFRELIKYAVRAVPEKSQEKASCSTSSTTPSPEWASSLEPSAQRCSLPSAPCSTISSPPLSSTGTNSPAPLARNTIAPDNSRPMSTSAASETAPVRSASSSTLKPDRVTHMAAGPAMVEWTAEEWLEWWAAMKGRRRTRTYGELFGLKTDEKPEDTDDEGPWHTIGKGRWTGQGYRSNFALLECIPGDKSILDVRVRYEKWKDSLWRPPDGWGVLHEQLSSINHMLEFAAMDR